MRKRNLNQDHIHHMNIKEIQIKLRIFLKKENKKKYMSYQIIKKPYFGKNKSI